MADIHSFESENDTARPLTFHLPVTKVDDLLHSGDLSQCGGSLSNKKAREMLGTVNAELQFPFLQTMIWTSTSATGPLT